MAELIQLLEQGQSAAQSGGVFNDALVLHVTQAEITVEKEISPELGQQLAAALFTWLRANEDAPDVRSFLAVMRLISKLIGRHPSVDAFWLQSGLVTSITSILVREQNKGREPRIVRSSLEVLASITVVEEADSIINKAGIVPALVVLLERRQDDMEILEDGITTLALLAQRTRHRRSLQADGRLPMVLDIVKSRLTVPPILMAISRFIKNFSTKEECCVALLHSGALHILLAAFQHLRQTQAVLAGGLKATSEDAKRQLGLWVAVLTAIWTCSADSTEVQVAMIDASFLPSLVAVLQEKPAHGDVVEACLGIIRGPCKLPHLRAEIVSLGFLQLAIESLRNWGSHMGVQKEACGVIGNLAVDEEIRTKIGNSNAIEEVVAALSRCQGMDDRKVAKLACGALANLASSLDNRDKMARTEVVRILLYVMQLFITNENVLEYGILTITHLAVHATCNEQLCQAGCIGALFVFAHQHAEDLNILSRSLAALRQLAKYCGGIEDNMATIDLLREIAHAGHPNGFQGVQLLVRMMQTHLYEAVLVRECAQLLSGIARDKAAVAALMECAVKPCMRALEVHKGDELTASILVEFLSQLPLEDRGDLVNEGSTENTGLLGDGFTSELATTTA